MAFPFTGFGPGFFLVRRWRGSPAEKLVLSVALSLLIVHFLAFGAFVLGLPPMAHVAILIACLGLTFASAREWGTLLESAEVRSLLGWLALLMLWSLAFTALIRNYSGGTWYGDWLEHYQRSLFYTGGMPADFRFQGDYRLPARPPLMNGLCAHYLSIVDRGYPIYQAASALLSTLVFLPAALLAGRFVPRGRAPLAAVAATLMLNPMFTQNATYAWTKLLAAFFVLLGVCLYLPAAPDSGPLRRPLAFAGFAAGVLAHYSAVPYLLFFALHYALFGSRRTPRRWREIGLAAGLCAAVLFPWFGWSIAHYGVAGTVASTSTVRDAAGMSGAENVIKVLVNLWNTLIPHPLRGVDASILQRGLTWGVLRDVSFKLYQQNLPLSFGLAGLAALLFATFRSPTAPPAGLPRRRFWIAFALFMVVVGIAVHGGDDIIGLAHICLQPLVLIGLIFAASRWETWPRGIRLAVAAGWLVDLALGIALQSWFQATVFDPADPARGLWHLSRRDLLIGSPMANWQLKSAQGIQFLGDAVGGAPALWVGAVALALLTVAFCLIFPRAAPAATSSKKS